MEGRRGNGTYGRVPRSEESSVWRNLNKFREGEPNARTTIFQLKMVLESICWEDEWVGKKPLMDNY